MAKKTNTNVNGYDYYRTTKTIGHKANGVPIKKQFYGSSKSEAEQKADDYIEKLKNGGSDADIVKQLFNESEDDLNNRTDVNTENEQNEFNNVEQNN